MKLLQEGSLLAIEIATLWEIISECPGFLVGGNLDLAAAQMRVLANVTFGQ